MGCCRDWKAGAISVLGLGSDPSWLVQWREFCGEVIVGSPYLTWLYFPPGMQSFALLVPYNDTGGHLLSRAIMWFSPRGMRSGIRGIVTLQKMRDNNEWCSRQSVIEICLIELSLHYRSTPRYRGWYSGFSSASPITLVAAVPPQPDNLPDGDWFAVLAGISILPRNETPVLHYLGCALLPLLCAILFYSVDSCVSLDLKLPCCIIHHALLNDSGIQSVHGVVCPPVCAAAVGKRLTPFWPTFTLQEYAPETA